MSWKQTPKYRSVTCFRGNRGHVNILSSMCTKGKPMILKKLWVPFTCVLAEKLLERLWWLAGGKWGPRTCIQQGDRKCFSHKALKARGWRCTEWQAWQKSQGARLRCKSSLKLGSFWGWASAEPTWCPVSDSAISKSHSLNRPHPRGEVLLKLGVAGEVRCKCSYHLLTPHCTDTLHLRCFHLQARACS